MRACLVSLSPAPRGALPRLLASHGAMMRGRAVPPQVRSAAPAVAPLLTQLRHVGGDFLLAGRFGDSRSLTESMRQRRESDNLMKASVNKEIMSALSQQQSGTEIRFRKEERPWEIVPQYVRRRVVDMVGILTSAHRMEMELMIEQVRPICDVDMYVVVVPTVGYTGTREFAQSIFFDWGIGEPRGNGLLFVVAQAEASIQVIASPAIEEYFGQTFIDLLIKEVLQPLLKEGQASYAVLQTTYALARHAQEVRHFWQNALVPLPVKNKIRFAEKTVAYGMRKTWTMYWVIALAVWTGYLWHQIYELLCPKCGTYMHVVKDEDLIAKVLNDGQRMEWENGCTEFYITKCPSCKHDEIKVLLHDLYNESRCQQCDDCGFHTVTMDSDIVMLATKKQDGLKRLTYKCHFCKVGREVDLPLYRPLDARPDAPWYDGLLDRASSAKSKARIGT